MMSAASDNSNLNGGSAMGMGGDERIASKIISMLLLVSDPLLLFGICSWRMCVVLVFVP